MDKVQFLQLLHREAYPEPVEVQQAPNGSLGIHEHPFAVKALVLEGDITITINNLNHLYQVGDVFQLDFKQPHTESYGPQGVKYWASRKEQQAAE